MNVKMNLKDPRLMKCPVSSLDLNPIEKRVEMEEKRLILAYRNILKIGMLLWILCKLSHYEIYYLTKPMNE